MDCISDTVFSIRLGGAGEENLVNLLNLTIISYEEPVDAIFKFLKDKNMTAKEKFIVLAYVCASTFDSYAYEISCKRKLPLARRANAVSFIRKKLKNSLNDISPELSTSIARKNS